MERLQLSDEDRRVMIDAAAAAYPEEACGIVTDTRCHVLPNRAEDRQATFRLAAGDIADACWSDGGGFRAVWHSHPSGNPVPSQTDWANHPTTKALVVVAGEAVNIYYGDEGSAPSEA